MNRIQTQAPRESFGLFAVIESKRVILPLKGVECDFSVLSGVAEVSMTQIFRQDNDKPLDCEYLFPLPADASVYFCEADINDRTIRAQVRERQEARRMVAEKKAAGFRTAMVEAERENLFTLSLGNLQPDDLVTIRLKYFQTLRSLAGMPSIEIPFCPGVRYIPGSPLLRSNKGKGIVDDTDEVPDASRISPVRIDAEHPDAAYVEVRGTLDGMFVNEKDLTSPSHAITVQRTGDQLRVSLADKGGVPDGDFVLRWREQNAEALASRAWVCQKNQDTYALLEIRAPKEAPTERAPVDFYFLVDRSGSMANKKWNKAAQALQSCLKVLGPADRAMVTFFEDRFQDFAEQPLSPKELLQEPQFQTIASLGTGGGTELIPALQHVLEVAAKHSANNYRNLILITDAQVGNEQQILEVLKPARNFPVHCFGIDVALNDSLLQALCRQQGGTFHSLNPHDDIEQAVTSLGKMLGQPVLLDLSFPEGWDPAESVIPNLYAGQIHYLSARLSSGQPLELTARGAASQPLKIQFEWQPATFDAPWLHWCRSRIQRLVTQGNRTEAVALSVESNLICQLTAFVAWDDSQKVPIARDELIQPALELAGRDRELLHIIKSAWCEEDETILRKRSMFSAGFSRVAARTDTLQESHAAEEAALFQELWRICEKTAVADSELLSRTLLVWFFQLGEPERLERLKRLVGELKPLAERFEQVQASQQMNEAEALKGQIHKILKEFLESLPLKDPVKAELMKSLCVMREVR